MHKHFFSTIKIVLKTLDFIMKFKVNIRRSVEFIQKGYTQELNLKATF